MDAGAEGGGRGDEKFYRGASCRIKAWLRLLLFLEQPSRGRRPDVVKSEATLSPLCAAGMDTRVNGFGPNVCIGKWGLYGGRDTGL